MQILGRQYHKVFRKHKIIKWICIFLPLIIVFALILICQLKREQLGIDAKGIQKITIITQPFVLGDNDFVIEGDKDIDAIVKCINRITYYPTTELPGESSPYASITFYKNNERFMDLDFYGGFAGVSYFKDNKIVKGEVLKTGFLTDFQLKGLFRKISH